MNSIEYWVNERNWETTIKHILEDWSICETTLDDNKKLDVLLLVEEKGKMIYQNLEDEEELANNVDLYTDICLQPQHILYSSTYLNHSFSTSINMNDIKALVVDLAMSFLMHPEIDFNTIQIFVIKLLILLVKSTKIISDSVYKCVLKTIVGISPKDWVSKERIMEAYSFEYCCPHVNKKCTYYYSKESGCIMTKSMMKDKIENALFFLVENKIVSFENGKYSICGLIEK